MVYTEKDRLRKAAWRAIPENRARQNELRRQRYKPEIEAVRWKETMPCPICDKMLIARYVAKHIARRHDLSPSADTVGQGGEAPDGTQPPRSVEVDTGEDVIDTVERLEGAHRIDIGEEDNPPQGL
eukprot:scaffold196650_cov30-Tisochrysis_lutea.AAC.1